MCGIFGVINKRIDKELAKKCLDTIVHRGPDAEGLWQEEAVTLGHRRLAILDLSEKGKQPMSYCDGRYMLIFNGEIYNFIEIRNELIKHGYSFSSDSDSEVILASFDKWGEDCVNKFNGMWAFLIYDRKNKKTFISRDRFGVKPLYYTKLSDEENAYAFGSEMKTLMPLIENPHANTEWQMGPYETCPHQNKDHQKQSGQNTLEIPWLIFENFRWSQQHFWHQNAQCFPLKFYYAWWKFHC